MSQPIIMLVSGNQEHFSLDRFHLENVGYQVLPVLSGGNALKALTLMSTNLMLLSWELPDLSALAVIRSVRANHAFNTFAKLPIVLLGGEIRCEDKLLAFETGVDLYLDENVSPKELVARVRSLLRRVNNRAPQVRLGR